MRPVYGLLIGGLALMLLGTGMAHSAWVVVAEVGTAVFASGYAALRITWDRNR